VQALKDYYKELWGWDTISNNKGFIAYSFPEGSEVAWINELFISEEERNGVTSLRDMAQRVEKLAKEKNKIGVATNLILVNSSGGVHSNPTRIVKIMLYWGFKIVSSDKNVITLFKEFEKNEKENEDNSSVQDKEK
jgi:hypothetical protein